MLKIPDLNEPSIDPLKYFPEGLRQYIKENGILREYPPNGVLMAPGDTGDTVRFLISGHATVIFREDGDRQIDVDDLKPGEMFGEISFLTGRPSPSDAELIADERCLVLEIPAQSFEKILQENHEFTLTLVRSLARKITRLDRDIYKSKQQRRALQSLISREDHIFPDYVIGDYVRRNLATRLQEMAETDGPVLIIGETGVGKEVLAHAIFRMSHQYKAVFLLLDMLRVRSEDNFGAPEPAVSTEEQSPTEEQMRLFFGSREKTAENSHNETAGYIELTEDGTLLVRAVEQLTPLMQEKLLDAVRTGTFRRYGGSGEKQAKIRLIATTNLDSSEISPEMHPLMHGLLDRSIVIPPLRKRRREIPSVVKHYLAKYAQELRKDVPDVPKETLNTLIQYSWPGNDVELSTTLKRAVLVSEGGALKPHDIYFDLKRVEGQGKFNLLRMPAAKQAILSPLFPAIFQSAVTPFFFILLVLLFLGPADLMRNPAALFSWAVGWPTIMIGAFFWARFWCSLCPIGTLSQLAKKVIALEKPFPTFLKNHSDLIIAAAVLGIIWLETATDIRHSPFNVGLLLMTMLTSAVVISVIYERLSWCRYLCGLGGMISVLAKGSIIELRADRNVCISQCTSNECYVGTSTREGCPFGQVGPKLHSNRFCKLCGSCVKNCPHSAINLNLRIPGKEIWEMRHTNMWTAFLIIGMLGGLLSELVHKMPVYNWLTAPWPFPEIVKFTIVFAAVLLIVNILLALATGFSRRVYDDTFEENYSRYGLALLPLTLAAFIAFHIYYLINLGVQLPILISETFQFEIFRQLIITVPPAVTLFIQQLLIWIGLLWSLMIIYRLGRSSHERLFPALEGMLPHAALCIGLAMTLLDAIKAFFYPEMIG
ncbi:MAG: sigma 54-interacting transcriptional regulator [Desulfomonile tiedjei]|nr:sigma 54-interacting transcriptional regulator [Desulfomonile tiedjei]